MQSVNDEVAEGEGEMIQHMQQIFQQYPRQKINRTWFTYMFCLNCIIEHLGDNNYKILHIKKAKMEQESTLPIVLHVINAAELLMEMMDATHDEEMDEDDKELENTNFC